MRLVRHKRVRQRIHGTSHRPRLALFRSLNHIYVQIIDDDLGHTLVAASSLDPEVKSNGGGSKGKVSGEVGALVHGFVGGEIIDQVVPDVLNQEEAGYQDGRPRRDQERPAAGFHQSRRPVALRHRTTKRRT